ncbi:MAG: ATP-binding cassette domain-containing protein, partial [Lachnospiraceae bacterium]|nr:ATP-binding cassette domain-containing protein [Lachnospiraceae bacterium]
LIAGLERPDKGNYGRIQEEDPGNRREGMPGDNKTEGMWGDKKPSELYEQKAGDKKNSGLNERKAGDKITSELYEDTDVSIVKKNGRQLPLNLISVMFQEDRLLPGISAKKQLEIAVPGCDAKKWLKAVELENESDTVPEKLSGGMKRRLALARCLAYAEDKELILLDEPFTGIDPGRIASISEVIRKMKKTVIVTGHTEETLKLADNIVIMEKR